MIVYDVAGNGDARNHRSLEIRINLVSKFAPEKLGRFETKGWNFLVF